MSLKLQIKTTSCTDVIRHLHYWGGYFPVPLGTGWKWIFVVSFISAMFYWWYSRETKVLTRTHNKGMHLFPGISWTVTLSGTASRGIVCLQIAGFWSHKATEKWGQSWWSLITHNLGAQSGFKSSLGFCSLSVLLFLKRVRVRHANTPYKQQKLFSIGKKYILNQDQHIT